MAQFLLPQPLSNAKHSSIRHSLSQLQVHPCYWLNLAANEPRYPTVRCWPHQMDHARALRSQEHKMRNLNLLYKFPEQLQKGDSFAGFIQSHVCLTAESHQRPIVSCSQFAPLILKEASGVPRMSSRQKMIMMFFINVIAAPLMLYYSFESDFEHSLWWSSGLDVTLAMFLNLTECVWLQIHTKNDSYKIYQHPHQQTIQFSLFQAHTAVLSSTTLYLRAL